MAKYIIEIPDEVPVSDELVPFDMCRPSWYWEAYKKGKADAEDEVWENAWKMFLTPEDFGATMGDSYSEAKAKYDAWKKSKEEIRVGDEVFLKGDPHKEKAIVLRLYQPKMYKPVSDVLWADGSVETTVLVEKLMRTDRHFDEVERLLERMKVE